MKPLNNSYRFFALTMAFVIFISSVSFSIDMHYCKGEFKTFSFFGKAKSCHDSTSSKMSNCPHHQKMMEASESCSMDINECCENKLVHIQSEVDEVKTTTEFSNNLELQHFVAAFVEVFFIKKDLERTVPNYQFYHPPIVVKDIPVLNQSFLL